MKKKLIVLLCAFMLAFGLTSKLAAASGPANPYWEFVFEDLGKIFFMTPDPGWWGTPQDVSRERMQIRSGLYYNVYPLVNIFYFDGYYRPEEAFFSECGTFLAGIKTEMPSENSFCQRMVSFYKNGELVGSYQREHFFDEERSADYLIRERIVQMTTGGIFWDKDEERAFDPLTNILTVVTKERNVFTFDITAYNEPLNATACCRIVNLSIEESEIETTTSWITVILIKLAVIGFFVAIWLGHMFVDMLIKKFDKPVI